MTSCTTRSSVEVDYKGLPLVALGVTYTPSRGATLIDPHEDDTAEWDVLCLRSDTGKHNLTEFLNYSHLDGIEEAICETFRE